MAVLAIMASAPQMLSPDTAMDMEVMAAMAAMDTVDMEATVMARDLLSPDMAMDMEDMVATDTEGMEVTGTMVNPGTNIRATNKCSLNQICHT